MENAWWHFFLNAACQFMNSMKIFTRAFFFAVDEIISFILQAKHILLDFSNDCVCFLFLKKRKSNPETTAVCFQMISFDGSFTGIRGHGTSSHMSGYHPQLFAPVVQNPDQISKLLNRSRPQMDPSEYWGMPLRLPNTANQAFALDFARLKPDPPPRPGFLPPSSLPQGGKPS